MKTRILIIAMGVMALSFPSCIDKKQSTLPLVDAAKFDTIIDNKEVKLYSLTNSQGLTLQVTNYGARVVTLFVPDRNGSMTDVVLGYSCIADYAAPDGERFLGSTIGRFGNRIAKGKFTLDGEDYQLSTFNNGQCLHGGDKGFDRVVWNVDSLLPNSIHFSYRSQDGEEGFPGNLDVKMAYTLTENNEFYITYDAETDKSTPVNLTNHSYFNLKGEANGTVDEHQLCIVADYFTPVDSVLIPLGDHQLVENTPFDFRQPTSVGKRVNEKNVQLKMGNGYDHNFVLTRKSKNDIELAATVYEPTKGIVMEVLTTEPGMQFYSGNFLDGKVVGKNGKPYVFRSTIVLETQHFPDSPNQPSYPSTILHPGEKYTHTCIYRFSTRNK